MSKKLTKFTAPIKLSKYRARSLAIKGKLKHSQILEFLPPGSFATIENQPNDLPPFQIINCKGGRCLIRQQSWGNFIQWNVPHSHLKSA